MKTPYKFKVGGRTWTVKVVAKMPKGLEHTVGVCAFDNKTIYVLEKQDKDERNITLLHEFMHMCFPPGIVGDKTEEKIVNGMDTQLWEILMSSGMVKNNFRIDRTVASRSKKASKKRPATKLSSPLKG